MGRTVRFGSYELRALLGKGGMAQVYRAIRVGPHGFAKEVALKILDPHATATQGQIDQLTDEARLGGLLRHPNIVATDELGQVGPFYYIAMELVDGWPLDRILRVHRRAGENIPRAAVLELLIEVCTGLDYVHALTDRKGAHLKLVHRDMKPANVMVGRNSTVKIMDFGIAKATTNLYETQEQSTRGTPLFMSPEQVAGGSLDGRSDLFSVGSMMQELVTGKKTFAGEELIPILRAVLEVDITEATERLEAQFPELLPVFLKCMKADPGERYASAADLRADLQALLAQVRGGPGLKALVAELGPRLPRVEDGELGDMLPGVIVVQDPEAGGNDTISMPMRAVDDVPSQFQMPLGPSAGPATGKAMTSEDSIDRLNWGKAYPDDKPRMPGWMASGSFLRLQGAEEEPGDPSKGFVKPGRPLAPSFSSVKKAEPPKKKEPTAPIDLAAVPKLPPGHPLFRQNTKDNADLPAIRAPAEPPKASRGARPGSRPAAKPPEKETTTTGPKFTMAHEVIESEKQKRGWESVPAQPVPKARRRPGTEQRAAKMPERKAGDALPKKSRIGLVVRAGLMLGVAAAIIYAYSHVPGTLGDIARAIMNAVGISTTAAG